MIELLIFCVMVLLVVIGEYMAVVFFFMGMAIYAAASGIMKKRK